MTIFAVVSFLAKKFHHITVHVPWTDRLLYTYTKTIKSTFHEKAYHELMYSSNTKKVTVSGQTETVTHPKCRDLLTFPTLLTLRKSTSCITLGSSTLTTVT